MFRSRRARLMLATLLFAALAAGGWTYQQRQRYRHFAVHQPGLVYRSGWLAPDVVAEVIETYQIRTVVNLCNPVELTPEDWEQHRRAVRGAGARLIEHTMPTSITITDPEIPRHLEIMGNPDNYPMLVHCQHGVTRTAKFLAIYDMLYRDMTAEESLAAQPTFGRDEHNVHVRGSVFDFEKRHAELFPSAKSERLQALMN